jgi:hypothetical protein
MIPGMGTNERRLDMLEKRAREACRQVGEVDLRKLDRHRGATIESLIPALSWLAREANRVVGIWNARHASEPRSLVLSHHWPRHCRGMSLATVLLSGAAAALPIHRLRSCWASQGYPVARACTHKIASRENRWSPAGCFKPENGPTASLFRGNVRP